MKIVWLGEALRELEEAALYYGDIDDELGERFSSAAEAAVAMIKARPEMSRKFDGEARKVRVNSFPYAVVYWLDADTLRILSVMHLHREPGYWHGRVKKTVKRSTKCPLISNDVSAATPKEACEILMREVLPLAKRMLAENGEFYPYGGITKLDGSIVQVAAQERDATHPESRTLVNILREEFQSQAANQEIEASAIVFDVLIRPPGETEKVDAIQVNLDHKSHYSVEVLFPYLIANGKVTYRPPFAQDGDYSIFGPKRNPQA